MPVADAAGCERKISPSMVATGGCGACALSPRIATGIVTGMGTGPVQELAAIEAQSTRAARLLEAAACGGMRCQTHTGLAASARRA